MATETNTSAPNTTFEPGSIYFMQSPCDSECIWEYEVVSRTKKMVTLKDTKSGDTIERRIRTWDAVEYVRPLGSYSMAPNLYADKKR